MWQAKVGWIAIYLKMVISDMHSFLVNLHPWNKCFGVLLKHGLWNLGSKYTLDQPKSELTLVYQSLVDDLTKYTMVMQMKVLNTFNRGRK